MYDTARRVALVKQRVRENTRRRQRREVISLSAACMLLFAVLMQAAGTVVGPGQPEAWGVFGAMLLRGGRGRLCAGRRCLLCRGGGDHRAVLPAQEQRKTEKKARRTSTPDTNRRRKANEKRILSILLLCCMVLTLLPTTAFAADELPDVKLSIPTTFDKTVYLTNQKKRIENHGQQDLSDQGLRRSELVFSIPDQNRWRAQENYAAHISGRRPPSGTKDGPAIELYGGASACLYFIGNDSELIGAENFAALQKKQNRWSSPGSGADGDKAHV